MMRPGPRGVAEGAEPGRPLAVAARRASGAVRVALGVLAAGLGIAAAWIFVFMTALRLLLKWAERMADDAASSVRSRVPGCSHSLAGRGRRGGAPCSVVAAAAR